MKRLPLVVSLVAVVAVVALSASVAYWFLQLYKPPGRPLVAAPTSVVAEPAQDAAATLFGGQVLAAVASTYQLTGVVSAGREGVAILVADGQPPKAVKVGKEIASGVLVTEVHPRYVMLSEGGVPKRIELATDAKAGPNLVAPVSMPPPQPQMAPPPDTPPPNAAETPTNVPPPPPVQMPPPTRNTFNPNGQQPNQQPAQMPATQ